jgi:hypothetical protein
MLTICTSLTQFPGGYTPVVNKYNNEKKSPESRPLIGGWAGDFGFEIYLDRDELEQQAAAGYTGPHSSSRQVRLDHNGQFMNYSHYNEKWYIGFTEEQTRWLYESMREVWGEENFWLMGEEPKKSDPSEVERQTAEPAEVEGEDPLEQAGVEGEYPLAEPLTIYTPLETVQGGFDAICELYNKKKPADGNPIRRGGFYEAGFEIPLEDDARESPRATPGYVDANDLVRQLRFYRGRLEAGYYIGFTREQTKLLYDVLVELWGPENVQMVV